MTDPTYYDRPLLQESVWTWAIPAYYFVGGLAGSALVLAAAAQLRKSRAHQRLVRRCRWIGVIGASVSAGLLIYDLGRPARFLNMLRVFRPTSPMNMGAWILAGAGASSTGALLLNRGAGISGCRRLSRRRGFSALLGRLGEACGYMAGIFGAGLATYTGVLVANTAVPVWQESRRMLPVLFGASAMASLGSVFEMCVEDPEERGIAKTFGTVGVAAELAAGIVMEKQASSVARVGRPFRHGLSGLLWRSAQVSTAASLLVRNRSAAGALGIVGPLLLRFAVERAGTVSARDPRASFHLERDRAKSR